MNQLKEVRETSFLDLNEIADHLSIPVIYLRAIEDGKFSQLPKKKLEEYITAYADFLEVDPLPIIAQYHHSQRASAAPISRRARKQESSKDWKSLLHKYRYPAIACGVCLLLALALWLFAPSPNAAEKKSTANQSNDTTVNNSIPVNKNRPVFVLQKESSDPEIEESWKISQVDSIRVQVQALGSVSLRIRENGINGNIIADKNLTSNESYELEGENWLVLHVDSPNKAKIKINDVTIGTEDQTNGTTYEFKIASAN